MNEFITSVSTWLTAQHAVELSGWVWLLLSILGIVGIVFAALAFFALSAFADIGAVFIKGFTKR